jgi:predicted RNA-binding protein
MAHWIFVVTTHLIDGEQYDARRILDIRLADGFWGLGEKTPNRKTLTSGDEVLFYTGNPYKSFSASASLASASFQLTAAQKVQFGHNKEFFTPDYGVLLENIKVWTTAVQVQDVLPGLRFIENKENWRAYFQGGVRLLQPEDYSLILQHSTGYHPEPSPPAQDLESPSEFALEAHLEEFIDSNWKSIDFGSKLARYTTGEQDGRQFPAGPWSIDFLCTDSSSGELVVIELKRGRTSDAAVGQVLRYIGWVQENLAQPGQRTRGIIVAREADDALRLAVSSLPNVSVLTYRVDFSLRTHTGEARGKPAA